MDKRKAYLCGSNQKWERSAKKLKAINPAVLAQKGKGGHSYMAEAAADTKALETSFLNQFSESPLRNFLHTPMKGFNAFKIFEKNIS